MPRKSPRSRRTPGRKVRVPGTARHRVTPGRGRAAARARTRATAREAQAGHAAARAKRPAVARRPVARRAAALRPASRRPVAARPAAIRTSSRARFAPPDPARVAALLGRLERLYPDAKCALDHRDPFELLIATILSAQCTDARVNQVTPSLFARYPEAAAFAGATQEELEDMIHSTGFFRNKARAIRECCADIVTRFGGSVPRTLEELTSLRGVGRKTANVVLGNAYGIPGLVVDTHVTRLSNRLGLTRERDAVKIELALMPIVPRGRWTQFSHWLILHGRSVCIARKPRCSRCPLLPDCPRFGVTASE
ncbi:MAG: endonuclease III [Candidatus Eisenbacteria bacterium]|nr:endonuclease III [Candidatus Eisenbacteria bacterium]